MKKLFVLFIFSFFILHISFSQEAGVKITNKSDKIEIIKGKKYYIHNVLKSQTLYSIAKAYSVSVEEIVNENPEYKKLPIAPGQKLKIPVKSQTTETKSPTSNLKPQPPIPVKKDSFLYHTIKSKETIYSISKKYNVTEDEIRNANTDQNMNLQIGQIIKIPYRPDAVKEKKKNFIQNLFKKSEDKNKTSDVKPVPSDIKTKNKPDSALTQEKKAESIAPVNESISKGVYNIALFLPLNLNEIDDIKTEVEDDSKEELKSPAFYKSFTFIQYYEGAMIALDSLKNLGLNAKLYVYDVPNDSNLFSKITQKPEFENMNIIICPQFKSNYNALMKYSKKHNIKLATYSQITSVNTKDHSQLFRLTPSLEEQSKQLAAFLNQKFIDDNIIIVYQSNDNYEKKCAELLKKELTKCLANNKNNLKGFKLIDLSNENLSSLKESLSSIGNNILVSYLNNEVLVSEYVRYLNDIRGIFKINLFGSQNWENFQNVEKDYLENLNMYLYSSNFIDYLEPDVKSFVNKFRKEYKTEPNLFAFLGYDAAFYFTNALLLYGKSFEKKLPEIKTTLLQSKFQFQKNENSGFENTYLNIYRYKDYKLVNARNE